jgi:two-component system sensor kinase FixL
MDGKEGLEALFEFASEGILVANQQGDIIRANPAAEKMFRYGKDELLGRKVEILIPRRAATRHVQERSQFHKNPHPRSMGIGMDLYGRRKDDTEFPVEVSLSPFTSKEGEGYVIAFVIDISIRKTQDEILKKNHHELQYYAEELKASNAELENFAYVSSHDLQEPLRKIQSFGDRLKTVEADRLSDQGKDYLNRVLNAAARMQVLINDLLLFSRVTSRNLPFVSVNLNQLLKEVLSDLEVSVEKTHAVITSEELPVIDAEPTQMRQLFQNLISNSIKFRNPETPLKIQITSKTNKKTPGLVELSFSDNGIGFEEKYNDRIFNIFQRLEGQKYEGSGIGLAICRKIAIRHGGNIVAQSEPGKGSSFLVTLAVTHLTPDPNHTYEH